MRQISVAAPAKLNLHLRIGGRRPDGFHDIESLFLALDFGDVLHFETVPRDPASLSAASSLEIVMNWHTTAPAPQAGVSAALPPEKNIISRAVSLFRSHTGYDKGLTVTVEKRIPLGGGLGGGSSDAAATLLALNRLAAKDISAKDGDNTCGLLDNADLIAMGASLGSDVPFFLYDTSLAWVRGRGEHVQPLEMPESLRSLSLVLVNPGFPSDTAEAYRLFDSTILSRRSAEAQSFERDLPFFAPSPKDWPFVNDFVPVFQAWAGGQHASGDLLSSYQLIFSRLRELGADFVGLSGSGSTCFGVFSNHHTARDAVVSFESKWPFIIETFPLAYRTIQ